MGTTKELSTHTKGLCIKLNAYYSNFRWTRGTIALPLECVFVYFIQGKACRVYSTVNKMLCLPPGNAMSVCTHRPSGTRAIVLQCQTCSLRAVVVTTRAIDKQGQNLLKLDNCHVVWYDVAHKRISTMYCLHCTIQVQCVACSVCVCVCVGICFSRSRI